MNYEENITESCPHKEGCTFYGDRMHRTAGVEPCRCGHNTMGDCAPAPASAPTGFEIVPAAALAAAREALGKILAITPGWDNSAAATMQGFARAALAGLGGAE